jgi:excisionase family DNA binding protein
MEEWLTTYEASSISGYELDYIRKLIRAGKISGRKWGQSWQVNRESLLQFLNQMETQGEKRGRKPIKPNSRK